MQDIETALHIIYALFGILLFGPRRYLCLLSGFLLVRIILAPILLLFQYSGEIFSLIYSGLYSYERLERFYAQQLPERSFSFNFFIYGSLLFVAVGYSILLYHTALLGLRLITRLAPMGLSHSSNHPQPVLNHAERNKIIIYFAFPIVAIFLLQLNSLLNNDDWVNTEQIKQRIIMALLIIPMIFTYICDNKRRNSFVDHLSGGFILFLRRFKSFADNSVVLSLLKLAPDGMPVLFLVDHDSNTTTLDPILVCLSGHRFFSSYRSMPLYLKAPLNDWQETVRFLIAKSSIVVVDITENSESMHFEIAETLASARNKAVWLARRNGKGISVTRAGEQLVLSYDTSWLWAIARILLGLAITIALFFSLIASLFPSALGGILLGRYELLTLNGVLLLLPSLFVCWFFVVSFCRPIVTPDSESVIRKAIEETLKERFPRNNFAKEWKNRIFPKLIFLTIVPVVIWGLMMAQKGYRHKQEFESRELHQELRQYSHGSARPQP